MVPAPTATPAAATGDLLWQASAERQRASHMARFAAFAATRVGSAAVDFTDFTALHRWSVSQPAAFWRAVLEFTGVILQAPYEQAYEPPPPSCMRGARWFSGARLNFAENLLAGADPLRPALIALAEG